VNEIKSVGHNTHCQETIHKNREIKLLCKCDLFAI